MNSLAGPPDEPARSSRWLRIGWLLLGALSVSLYLIRQIADGPYGKDFTIFLTGATILAHGQGAHLYDLATQASTQQGLSGRMVFSGGVLPFNYPPWVALLFAPFTLLPPGLSMYVWVAAQWVLLAGLVLWARSAFLKWFGSVPSTLLLMFFGFAPIFESLLMGQMSIVLLALWWWAFVSWREERWGQLGIAVALSAFKPQMAIFLVAALLVQRRWRALGWALLAQAALWAIVLPFTGLQAVSDYIGILKLSTTTVGTLGFYPQAMPNLRGLLAMLAVPPDVTLQLSILAWLSGIAVALLIWRPSLRWPLSVRFGLTVLMAVLLSPHLYIHDASLLLAAVLCTHIAYLERKLTFNGGWLLAPFVCAFAAMYAVVLQLLPSYFPVLVAVWFLGVVLLVLLTRSALTLPVRGLALQPAAPTTQDPKSSTHSL